MVYSDVSGMDAKNGDGWMKIDITFVVTTYNQAGTVLQTLESIKYQLEHFGGNNKIQIIVADDCSADGTQKKIQIWMDKNKNLFEQADIIFGDENRGTCKNAAHAFRKVKGKTVFSMSGDDLLMNNDVIGRLKRLSANEIIVCPPLKFREDSLITDASEYYGDIRAVFYRKGEIRYRSCFSCPVINGSLIGRRFYNESAYAFCERFYLLEDRARYMDFFIRNKRFVYGYSDKPILLYRKSDTQVTNNSATRKWILKDVKSMSRYAFGHTRNPILKMRIKMELIKIMNQDLYHRFWKYFDIEYYSDLYYFKIRKRKIKNMADKLIQYGDSRNINQYIGYIRNKSLQYMQEEVV